jgi:NADH dehydrogenase
MALPSHLSLRIPESELPRIVIVGGGFAGLNLAKKLRKVKAQVVMLDRNNFHTFQPLLYQVATAGLEPDSIAGPLRKTFESQANYFFRMVRVTGVDLENKRVNTLVGDISYDYLVLANGSKTNYFNNQKIRDNALPLKRIIHALNMRSHILQMFEQAVLTPDPEVRESLMNVVVVGGGPTGVEVSGALAELRKHILPKDYPDLDWSKMKIYLVEGSDKLLGAMSEKSSLEAMAYMQSLGIKVITQTFVKDYDGEEAELSNGKMIKTKSLVWAAGVIGNIPQGFNEDQIQGKRILVDEFNKVFDTDNVYAIGDIAVMATEENPHGHPMLAPVAIQQGKLLADNFKQLLKDQPLEPFTYFDKGTMATIGRNKAVVDMPGGMHVKGFFAWLIWMFVHIMYLIGFRNRLITLNNWIWSYFTYDKGTRLIVRVFNRKERLLSRQDGVTGAVPLEEPV